MKWLFALFLICSLLFTTYPNAWENEISEFDQEVERLLTHVEEAEKHSVLILSFGPQGGLCSGAVLKNSMHGADILTAKHCIGVVDELYVESVPVIKIQTSVSQDLALLKTSEMIPNKSGSVVALKDAKLFEELFGVGYPSMNPFIMHGTVFIKGIHNHHAKMEIIPGCSGGGIYNTDGFLVGIVWGYTHFGLGIYEPVTQIRKFLEEIEYY